MLLKANIDICRNYKEGKYILSKKIFSLVLKDINSKEKMNVPISEFVHNIYINKCKSL